MHPTRQDFPVRRRKMLEHYWCLFLFLAIQTTRIGLRNKEELYRSRRNVRLSQRQMWKNWGLEMREKMCWHWESGKKCHHYVRYNIQLLFCVSQNAEQSGKYFWEYLCWPLYIMLLKLCFVLWHLWVFFDICGHIVTFVDISWHLWTYCDICGLLWHL